MGRVSSGDARRASPEGLAEFELIERLGRGAFGSVWRARMRSRHGLTREVAVKITEGGDDRFQSRMRDEARILGLLRHRAIVHVEDLIPLDGERWAMVMEVIDGADLGAVLKGGTVPPAIVLEIVAEVADALHCAYVSTDFDGKPLRLAHRDIKPSNLMMGNDGRIKVLDFGIASAQLSVRESTTSANEVFGTQGYMAPERLLGADSVSGDAYSLAVVAYELCTRKRFGATSTAPEAHRAKVEEAMAAPEATRIPEGLRALIVRTLLKPETERPSLLEIRDEARALRAAMEYPPLASWAAGAVAHARRVGASDQRNSQDTAILRERDSGSRDADPAPSRLGKAQRITGLLVLLFASMLLGWAMGTWDGSEKPGEAPVAVEASESPAGSAPSAPTPATVTSAAATPATPAPAKVTSAAATPATPAPAKVTSAAATPATPAPPRRPKSAAAGTAPVPEAAAAPAPVAAPVVAAPALVVTAPQPEVDERGAVQVSGDAAEVWAESAEGRYRLPGAVPPGSYDLLVRFEGGEPIHGGRVWVEPGAVARVKCTASTRACTAR